MPGRILCCITGSTTCQSAGATGRPRAAAAYRCVDGRAFGIRYYGTPVLPSLCDIVEAELDRVARWKVARKVEGLWRWCRRMMSQSFRTHTQQHQPASGTKFHAPDQSTCTTLALAPGWWAQSSTTAPIRLPYRTAFLPCHRTTHETWPRQHSSTVATYSPPGVRRASKRASRQAQAHTHTPLSMSCSYAAKLCLALVLVPCSLLASRVRPIQP